MGLRWFNYFIDFFWNWKISPITTAGLISKSASGTESITELHQNNILPAIIETADRLRDEFKLKLG